MFLAVFLLCIHKLLVATFNAFSFLSSARINYSSSSWSFVAFVQLLDTLNQTFVSCCFELKVHRKLLFRQFFFCAALSSPPCAWLCRVAHLWNGKKKKKQRDNECACVWCEQGKEQKAIAQTNTMNVRSLNNLRLAKQTTTMCDVFVRRKMIKCNREICARILQQMYNS